VPEPKAVHDFRDKQLAGLIEPSRGVGNSEPVVTDDELRASVAPQLRLQRQRGGDLTIFSPRASGMAHHIGTEESVKRWTAISDNLIHRVCKLFPDSFAPVGQLPQHPGVSPANCIPELVRIVEELGFIGVNLNPDPSGGYWTGKPLTDREWYPLYEKFEELQVPGAYP
jgi:4-oxalmesaconate hydratase